MRNGEVDQDRDQVGRGWYLDRRAPPAVGLDRRQPGSRLLLSAERTQNTAHSPPA